MIRDTDAATALQPKKAKYLQTMDDQKWWKSWMNHMTPSLLFFEYIFYFCIFPFPAALNLWGTFSALGCERQWNDPASSRSVKPVAPSLSPGPPWVCSYVKPLIRSNQGPSGHTLSSCGDSSQLCPLLQTDGNKCDCNLWFGWTLEQKTACLDQWLCDSEATLFQCVGFLLVYFML